MAAKRSTEYPMGSVSHGTMRPEDLIPTFLRELEHRMKRDASIGRDALKRHREIINRKIERDYWDTDQPDADLEELFDALDEYSGPMFYFGAHPGDGSDYGYWLDESWEQQLEDDGGIKVNGTEDIPKDHRGLVAVVSDHGNVTLYNKTARKLNYIWAVV